MYFVGFSQLARPRCMNTMAEPAVKTTKWSADTFCLSSRRFAFARHACPQIKMLMRRAETLNMLGIFARSYFKRQYATAS
jgi:hypothetical protein